MSKESGNDRRRSAGRLVRPGRSSSDPGGSTAEGGRHLGGFRRLLARAVSAAASNVGGPKQLISGRSGSWEASLVTQMVYSTLGYDPSSWLAVRTERLVVTLNVAELVEDPDEHPGLLGMDDALSAIDLRYEAAGEDRSRAHEDEVQSTIARYSEQYVLYGERFTAAVGAAAVGVDGLHVPVVMRIDADPFGVWWTEGAISNPDPCEADEFVLRLWQVAHETLPLPNVDIDLRSLAETEAVEVSSGREASS